MTDSYWSSAWKLKYGNYKQSQYRIGMNSNLHSQGFDLKVPWQERVREGSIKEAGFAESMLYKPPFNQQYPRECAKLVNKYYECRESHGVRSVVPSVPQCSTEKAHIFEDCPHWVLENMAFKRRFYKRAEHIDNLTYKRAMEISDYNK